MKTRIYAALVVKGLKRTRNTAGDFIGSSHLVGCWLGNPTMTCFLIGRPGCNVNRDGHTTRAERRTGRQLLFWLREIQQFSWCRQTASVYMPLALATGPVIKLAADAGFLVGSFAVSHTPPSNIKRRRSLPSVCFIRGWRESDNVNENVHWYVRIRLTFSWQSARLFSRFSIMFYKKRMN